MNGNPLLDQDLGDPRRQRDIVEAFRALYFHQRGQTFMGTWLGVPLIKCPFDLWIYQEILHQVRPDVIVETGTYRGGSALYLAGICDLLDHGRVITIDVTLADALPVHPRVTFLHGSSVGDAIWRELASRIQPGERVLVILDSDHSRHHVLAELERYHALVSDGSYLIVEDTMINDRATDPGMGPGPLEALEEFLPAHPELRIDRSRERLLLSFNASGYLRKDAARVAGLARQGAGFALAPRSAHASAAGPFAAQASEREETIAWLHGEVAMRDEMVALLHQEVARRDVEVERLHREVAVRDAEAARLAASEAEYRQRWEAFVNSRLGHLARAWWRLRRAVSAVARRG
jgi:cephalosporin hydroxylase